MHQYDKNQKSIQDLHKNLNDSSEHLANSVINTGIPGTDLPNVVSWIQNVAAPKRNGCIRKVFELVEPRFPSDIEHDFRFREIFPYRDRNRNCDRDRILNPWL